MYTKLTTVCNPTGLHARPATEFVTEAKKYKSKITIQNTQEPEEEAVNAKSVVLLLSLGLGRGTPVKLAAEGEDEKEAVEALAALIHSGFGE